MLGLDNRRGEGMDQTLGLSAMMDSFPRHYGFPPQAGYNPWPMIPSLAAVPQQPNTPNLPQKGATDLSGSHRAYQGQEYANGNKISGMPIGGPMQNIDRTPPSPPAARERFSYTRYQLELLNVIYQKIRYPNSMQKQLIGKRVGITRDQVKIWFQNRRRKDITGKKNNLNPADASMVPNDILQSVVQELLKFENDPKGKKVTESMKEYNKKVSARKRVSDELDTETQSFAKRQRHLSNESTSTTRSTNSSIPLQPTELPEIFFAGESSPQGSNASEGQIVGISRLSPNSRSTESTSFSSDHSSYQIHSIESGPSTPYSPNDSTGSITSPGEPPLVIAPPTVPSAEQLDMNAPPNVVALPLDEATLERPRSLESPALGPHIDGAVHNSSPTSQNTDSGLGIQSARTVKMEATRTQVAPPNTVAPPSEKLNFDLKKQSMESKPMSVNIPQLKGRSVTQNQSVSNSHLNVSNTSSRESLTTPSPVHLFCNSTPQAWSQPIDIANTDKVNNQQQYSNDLNPQPFPNDTSNMYAEPLSSHYEKVFAPYMVGFFPNQGGYMQQGQSQMDHMYKDPVTPFMYPSYPIPFSSYEMPSDLSLKKQY